MKIELKHLPDPDLSPNKRLHWTQVARARAIALVETVTLVKEQGRPDTPYDKVHITVTWIAKDKRRRDPDNLFAAMKPYIDGLVDAELIADDSAMHVSYTIRYERGEKDNTIIEVKEIG